MEIKPILKVVPGLQATALLGYNLKAIPKIPNKVPMKSKPTKKMNIKPTKKLVKLGATNLIGIGLIGATASAINKL